MCALLLKRGWHTTGGGSRAWTALPSGRVGPRARRRSGQADDSPGTGRRIHDLFRRRQREVTRARLVPRLQAQADAKGLIAWDGNADSTICRTHQHAAGASKKERRRRVAGFGREVGRRHQTGRSPGPEADLTARRHRFGQPLAGLVEADRILAGEPRRLGPVRRIKVQVSIGAGEPRSAGSGASSCKAEEGVDAERRQATTTPQMGVPDPASAP